MKVKYSQLDADESIFFHRQLEFLKSKSYDIVYPELKARQLIPVSYEAGPGADTIAYEQYDMVGVARIISSYADDLPRADVKGKEFVGKVRSIGDSFGFTIQEIRAARFANKPLEQRRADAARRAALQLENTIAWFGDTTHGLGGLLNNANIPEFTIPADGTGASALWTAKSADQILRDMNGVANLPIVNTKGTHVPDTMLLPVAQYALISSTPRSSTSDTTILNYFLANNPFIKKVEWLNELTGAYAGPTNGIFVYKKDPNFLTLEVPQDFEMFPVQERNLELITPCHMRTGGVKLYYPLACAFGKGI